MIVVRENPPFYREMVKAFPIQGKRVIFCWGNRIYNPTGVPIGPELMAHEAVHCLRQNGKPEDWWRNYLVNRDFRLAEELPAHVAEFQYLREHAPNRNARRAAVNHVALKLSSPVYGRLIPFAAAKVALLEAA